MNFVTKNPHLKIKKKFLGRGDEGSGGGWLVGVGVCGWVGAGVSKFSSPMNPKKKNKEIFLGGGARVSDFLNKESKSKKKKVFFFFCGGGGGDVGG